MHISFKTNCIKRNIIMNILQIELFAIKLPLNEPFTVSYASYNTLLSLIVKTTLNNGVLGYGEGLHEYVTGESIWSL